jgi:imidazolonepropionase-like amidohydrolase
MRTDRWAARLVQGAWWLRAVAGFGVILVSISSAAAQKAPKPVVLEGALLIDGSGRPPLANSVLIIEEGRVRAIGKLGAMRYPEGAEVVSLRGKTIMPALINLHGHLGQTRDGFNEAPDGFTTENLRDQLKKYLAYGVGTVVSLGADQDLIYSLRAGQRGGEFPGARLYTAGRGFGVKGGYPPGAPPQAKGATDRYRPLTAEEARADVRELAARQPDFVKIWLDDGFGRFPKMKPEIFRAVIDEAHQHGLRVVAHVFYMEDAKRLVEAGVDGLGHSIRDLAVDRQLIDAMKARGVFLIPTLVRDESTFAYADSPRWLDDPFFQAGLELGVLTALKSPAFINKNRANPDLPKLRAAFEMGKKNLKTLLEAGVKIGFGTDSGPPTRFQGFFEHRELQLMVESGLTPMQAIVAATRSAAEILGADPEFGTLAPGKQADFLVLDANPLEDIRNTEELSAVWQAGKPLPPISAGR